MLEIGTNNVKIGMSKSPRNRRSSIQSGNSREVKTIATIACKSKVDARELEKELHQLLDRFRCTQGKNRNEFFTLPQNLVEKLKDNKDLLTKKDITQCLKKLK